jgi:hypothetical protein
MTPDQALQVSFAAARDPNDYTNRFNTKLSASEEREFMAWAVENNRLGDLYDYDMRGAWKELTSGSMQQADNGHLGDRYKKPNHPTFSTQSKYASRSNPGGVWEERNGATVFKPSRQTIRRFGKDGLMSYAQRAEPNVIFDFGDN